MEIGDKFIINWKHITSMNNAVVCKYKSRVFTVSGFTKTRLSVYFYDNKTNNDCECYICDTGVYKSILVSNTIIVQTKIQFERDKKIKQILK
jgi:hypothetical protein